MKSFRKVTKGTGRRCQGGPDSMAILDFLNNNHNVTAVILIMVQISEMKCKSFVKDFCDKKDIPLVLVLI